MTDSPTPVRIQRKRTKGYDMQAHSHWMNGLSCVYVGRPGKWGNPYKIGEDGTAGECVEKYRAMLIKYTHKDGNMVDWILTSANIRAVQLELQGKNLSCFCPLDQPCHSMVLLDIATNNPKWEV